MTTVCTSCGLRYLGTASCPGCERDSLKEQVGRLREAVRDVFAYVLPQSTTPRLVKIVSEALLGEPPPSAPLEERLREAERLIGNVVQGGGPQYSEGYSGGEGGDPEPPYWVCMTCGHYGEVTSADELQHDDNCLYVRARAWLYGATSKERG